MAVNGNIFLPIGGFPIDKTHSSRRKDRIRKTKTDKVDTIVIAETLMMRGVLTDEDQELRELTDSALKKLNSMTEDEYSKLELYSDFDE